MIPLDKELEAVQLRAEGHTLRDIAARLRIDKDAVARICRERGHELARLKAEFLEEVNAQAAATYAERIKRQGETLRQLYQEFARRLTEGNALDKVPTDRLIELIGKQELMLAGATITPPEDRAAPARAVVNFITETTDKRGSNPDNNLEEVTQ